VRISPHLIDTNILLRIARRDNPDHAVVDSGTALYYTHQNIAEFWNVTTRPTDRNGFGLTPAHADRETRAIESGMVLLPDSEAIYHEWRRIVGLHSVFGVRVHDARLVAAMKVHAVTHLPTLNTEDFARYPDITVVHPGSLAYSS
jgi:predicted nucleic acid-binding protein